jgi:hypothetical protein
MGLSGDATPRHTYALSTKVWQQVFPVCTSPVSYSFFDLNHAFLAFQLIQSLHCLKFSIHGGIENIFFMGLL